MQEQVLSVNDLKKEGYENLDGIDGSKGLLEKDKEQSIYKHIQQLMIAIDPTPEDLKLKYDIIVSNGCFFKNNFTKEAFGVFFEMCKPNG